MKNIRYSIFILISLAILIHPSSVFADELVYEENTPAEGNYTGFCDASYHGNRYCEFTNTFSLDSDQIVKSITFYDIGCNSRDEVEMFISYALVNADNHNIISETIHKSHKVCTPDYPPGHNVPTTLEIEPTRLSANQDYYLMLRASNNERARAYWGVNSVNRDSFQLHGFPVPKDPVILIPGIMGSSLKRVSDGGEVWPNVDKLVVSGSDDHLNVLALHANGSQMSGQELQPDKMLEQVSFHAFGQNLATQIFYGNLVQQFKDRGYVLGKDLFEVAYDWRLDLRSETARLKAVIDTALEKSPNGKVSIVAHSMGGLLTKQYLSVPENVPAVDKVVLVGSPQLGAPAMFRVLNYGDNLGFQTPILQRDILNSKKVKDIVQNMPGVYELLPSRRYVSNIGGYVKDFRNGKSKTLSHSETSDFMTESPSDFRNSNLMSMGQSFHDSLDEKPILGPEVYNLAACGNPSTIGSINIYDNDRIDIVSTDGDGTVPLASATHLSESYRNYFISSAQTGIDHGRLIKDGRATDLIRRLIEGVEVPPVAGIATSSSICAGITPTRQTFRFSTHSPVALHVYDSAGRHTGPVSEGNIEMSIPESNYMTLGENSFIFVPAEGNYRVVVDALAEGRFSLQAKLMEDSNTVGSANYIDIPLSGDETSAEASFSVSNLNPNLFLDSDGDGTSEKTISPTAQIFGLAATDSEPPALNVSGVPTGTIMSNTRFTINFSASDTLSGLATIRAELDGNAFSSGATFTSLSPGSHAIFVQAVDKAGNPKVFSAGFNVVAVTSSSSAPAEGGSASQQSGGDNQNSSRRNTIRSYPAAGSVLGASTTVPTCLSLPIMNLARSRGNDFMQVVLLQAFLNRELGLNIPTTGFFGPITEIAVKIFQLKYYPEVLVPVGLNYPTGFVGKYTLAKMNSLACS